MSRTSISARCVALLVALCCAVPAAAQEDAPRLDPSSPAGSEYQLPVDRAREEARGGAVERAQSDDERAPAPLFGEGVEPDGGAAAGGSGSGSTDGSGPSAGGVASQPP